MAYLGLYLQIIKKNKTFSFGRQQHFSMSLSKDNRLKYERKKRSNYQCILSCVCTLRVNQQNSCGFKCNSLFFTLKYLAGIKRRDYFSLKGHCKWFVQ